MIAQLNLVKLIKPIITIGKTYLTCVISDAVFEQVVVLNLFVLMVESILYYIVLQKRIPSTLAHSN